MSAVVKWFSWGYRVKMMLQQIRLHRVSIIYLCAKMTRLVYDSDILIDTKKEMWVYPGF